MKVDWIVTEMCLPFSTFQSLKGRWKSYFSKNWNVGFFPVIVPAYADILIMEKNVKESAIVIYKIVTPSKYEFEVIHESLVFLYM